MQTIDMQGKIKKIESPSLRERQKERRRARIYQVAMELFKVQGFHMTTAADIAQHAHVSRGTFFNYYPYKEAVLLEYGSEIILKLQADAYGRLAQQQDPIAVLRQFWGDLVTATERDRSLIPPLAYELLNPDPERARTAYQMLPMSGVVAMILTPMYQSGILRSDISLERMCHTISDTYLMTALRWSAYGGKTSLAQEMQKALDFLLDGAYVRS